ncbi:CODH nickel-insertion accessory protein [sediment metagenome]|uniref:CODH nickel-insertion accessory protein n=1 Tax=sediment metagenome TaxID=749907 RepID=D9PKM1_9ZZZZ
MAKIIVSTGRGGTGKTTFVALAARYLEPPSLLIDLDPDQNLADMLGINLEEGQVKTVSDALYGIIQEKKSGTGPVSTPLHSQMEYLLQSDCLYEGDRFDLLTLGAKLVPGCYCVPDDLLKVNIPRLAESYRNVVIDSPAGVEHLNRKVTSKINELFVFLDPSLKSIKHIKRVEDITKSVGIHYDHISIVGNHEFTPETEDYLRKATQNYIGKVAYDEELRKYNLSGKSLLGLPDDSAACLSVKSILKDTGSIV